MIQIYTIEKNFQNKYWVTVKTSNSSIDFSFDSILEALEYIKIREEDRLTEEYLTDFYSGN